MYYGVHVTKDMYLCLVKIKTVMIIIIVIRVRVVFFVFFFLLMSMHCKQLKHPLVKDLVFVF